MFGKLLENFLLEKFGKFVISKTKLGESFPSGQFNISNYEIRDWRDRDNNGGV